MRSRVELFEQIRRDREFGGMSTHALARKYGMHRRTVRQALESPRAAGAASTRREVTLAAKPAIVDLRAAAAAGEGSAAA